MIVTLPIYKNVKDKTAVAKLTVAIGSDHAGMVLRAALVSEIEALGYEVLDFGTHTTESVDYPDFGYQVARAVSSGAAWRGVLICGSGIGMSIAANRYPKVRAALCLFGQMARMARAHNDANVLVLGERLTGVDVAKDALKEFMATEFEGGRHARRVDKISEPQGFNG
jgi:ribose 5-phosphate isomerase B